MQGLLLGIQVLLAATLASAGGSLNSRDDGTRVMGIYVRSPVLRRVSVMLRLVCPLAVPVHTREGHAAECLLRSSAPSVTAATEPTEEWTESHETTGHYTQRCLHVGPDTDVRCFV
jgi:hypothetical protein